MKYGIIMYNLNKTIHFYKKKLPVWFEPAALINRHIITEVTPAARLELATFRLEGEQSVQLIYAGI